MLRSSVSLHRRVGVLGRLVVCRDHEIGFDVVLSLSYRKNNAGNEGKFGEFAKFAKIKSAKCIEISWIREIREILIPEFQKKWRPIREIKFPRKFDPAKIKTLKVFDSYISKMLQIS